MLILLATGLSLVLSVWILRKGDNLVREFWPPADLYEPLLVEDLRVDELDVREFEFAPAYVGSHAVSIRMSTISPVTETLTPEFVLQILGGHPKPAISGHLKTGHFLRP